MAGDVIAESVAHRVRREVCVNARAAAELHDDRPQYLARRGLELQVHPLGIAAGITPALGRDHELANPRPFRRVPDGRLDARQDLGDDRLELGKNRDPALAAALGNVGALVHPARPLEVAALQMPQLVVADAGADAQEGDAPLPPGGGGAEERDDLLARHPVDVRLARLGRPRLPRRVRVTRRVELLHRPVVKRHEDRAVLSARIRARPPFQRALDVVAERRARVAIVDVGGVHRQGVAVAALGVRTVDAPFAAHVGDVEVDRVGKLHAASCAARRCSRARACVEIARSASPDFR
ncbi:MAG TPA: hypothetical protein VFZ00_07235 [Solirubrobacter sp.]|nr:hypothetical protein [Solirubrobacter sp.]